MMRFSFKDTVLHAIQSGNSLRGMTQKLPVALAVSASLWLMGSLGYTNNAAASPFYQRGASQAKDKGIQVVNLTLGYHKAGDIALNSLDQVKPDFGWQLLAAPGLKDVLQEGYQIQVASSRAALENGTPDYWDTKKVNADHALNIPYEGKSLEGKSFQQLFWRVRVWTNKGASDWSEISSWRMGFMRAADRQADWIGYEHPFSWDSVKTFPTLSARYLRKEFTANKQIQSAICYISGLGMYELHINAQRAGDAVLAPGPTDYTKTVFYNALDVTNLLKTGKNAIGVTLGSGRLFAMRQDYKPWKWRTFGYPKLYFQLRIEYTDGSVEEVLSDKSWQLTAQGPIRNNNEYDGERYDANMELPGWDQVGYHEDTTRWQPVEIVTPPAGRFTAQPNNNMKVMQVLKPRDILPAKNGGFIIDLGQNMAGWLRMQVDEKGHKGDTLTLRYAESLVKDENGKDLNEGGYQLYTANLRDAKSTDHYIMKGAAHESWAPQFSYHGFRYVEVSGYPKGLSIEALMERFTAEVVYDQMDKAGEFESSDSTINQIYKNAVWGILSNYKGMPIDCPQRNERQPWLGDRTTGAYGESFAFNNRLLYDKWLADIQDAQLATGSIPDVAPNFWLYYKDDVTWPSTFLTVADMLYHQYADKKVIVDRYAAMKFWIQYMSNKYVKQGLIKQDSYGDWCVPPDKLEEIHSSNQAKVTSGELIATATFYHDLQLMQRFAKINGTLKDTAIYAPMARVIRQAFNKKYFQPDSGYYGNNTVTANLLPLAFGLADKADEQRIFDQIVHTTVVKNNTHISSGVIGIQWLLRTLSRYGRNDLALQLTSTRSYPGWGFMVDHGATTIWELWNGNTANPAMNSQNHVMLLGDLLVWLYENQAGIKNSASSVGYKALDLAPTIQGHLQYVKASYQTPYGLVSSHWQKNKGEWSWQVDIPAGATAKVHCPEGLTAIKQDGKPLTSAKAAELSLGSGSYQFTAQLQ